MRNSAGNTTTSIEDQIKDLENKRDEANASYKTAEGQKFQDQIDKLKSPKKPKEKVENKTLTWDELIDGLIKKGIVPASMERDILQKQLADLELKRSGAKEQATDKRSKDEIIRQLKESLNQKDTMLNDLAMTKETMINWEFLKHKKLKNMYARIQKLKNKNDNGKSAVIYFMAMESWKNGGNIKAVLNRGVMKIGFFNTENVKKEMKTCLEKYAEQDSDSPKTKSLKRIIYSEIKNITNNYLDSVTKDNIIA